jgi:hypothetical protein
MNFGQPLPAPARPVSYQVSVPCEEFVQRLEECCEKRSQEERADATYRSPGEFPVLDRWQELGYPPLGDLLAKEPAVAEGLIKDWLGQEVLDRLVPGPEHGLPGFLVNTIDRVTVSGGHVRIEGIAYAHPHRLSRV